MRFSSTLSTVGKQSDFSKVKPDSALLVVWLDIHNDEGGWKTKKEVVFTEYQVETLGWFHGVQDGQLMLYADKGSDGDTNTRMVIPLGCIRQWKVVKLA